MLRAWNLGTIFGIKLQIHWTFLLLPIYIYMTSIIGGSGIAAAFVSVLFVVAIFGCVLLHELGHALAAREFGVGTRHITLLPIGGVAALERMPRKPSQEFWIAIAGPAVNVVIAIALLTGLLLGGVTPSTVTGQFLWRLLFANVVLVIFNLIPAFPMDGGRVLRSLLAMFMDYRTSTRVAVSVGKFCAIGFGVYGLFSGNLFLALIAAFIYFAAGAENYQVASEFAGSRPFGGRTDLGEQDGTPYANNRSEGSFSEIPASSSRREVAFLPPAEYASHFTDADNDSDILFLADDGAIQADVVPATLAASSVAAWLNSRGLNSCKVVDSGRVIGTLNRHQLSAAIHQGFGRAPVGQLVA